MILRTLGRVVVAALAAVPLGVIATLLLQPLWSWIEARFGIESMGHSGPATWCYLASMLTLFLVLATLLTRALDDRDGTRRKGP